MYYILLFWCLWPLWHNFLQKKIAFKSFWEFILNMFFKKEFLKSIVVGIGMVQISRISREPNISRTVREINFSIANSNEVIKDEFVTILGINVTPKFGLCYSHLRIFGGNFTLGSNLFKNIYFENFKKYCYE